MRWDGCRYVASERGICLSSVNIAKSTDMGMTRTTSITSALENIAKVAEVGRRTVAI